MAYVETPEQAEFKHYVNSSLDYFKQQLSISSNLLSHMGSPCPFCGNKDSMQWGPDKNKLGEHYFHCHACGNGGDTLKAMTLRGMAFRDVLRQCHRDFPHWKPGTTRSGHTEYHQQRQQEIQRNRVAPPQQQSVGYSNGTANGTVHSNGHVPAFQNTQPVFPPRALPVQPQQRQVRQASPQYSQPVNRGYALPQPSFTENQQPLVHQPALREPVLNLDLANQFVETHHKYLLDNWHLMKKYRRGITKEVAEKYKLGFGEMFPVQFRPWKKGMRAVTVPAAWVLPITNEKGDLRGVKIHCEETYKRYDSSDGPKCFWMPFGTQPAYQAEDKEKGIAEVTPEHCYRTLWPHPDTLQQKTANDFSLEASWWIERIPEKLRAKFQNKVQEFKIMMAYEKAVEDHLLDSPAVWECQLKAFDALKKEIMDAVMKVDEVFKAKADVAEPPPDKPRTDWAKFIFMCPGELKALAWESMGFMASGTTGGESWMAPAELLKKFAGQAVCLPCDEDAPKRVFKKKDGEVVKSADGQAEILRIVCAGKSWGAKWGQALEMYGSEKVVVKYGGQKTREVMA